MDQLTRLTGMSSPNDRGLLIRRPFGEITNFQSPTSTANSNLIMPDDKTPSKLETDGTGNGKNPQEEEALTPLANLKMLIRVASETEAQPSRRELFKEDSLQSLNPLMMTSEDSLSRIDSECREYTELQPQGSTTIKAASTFGSMYPNEDGDSFSRVNECGMSQSACGSYDSGINSIGSQENMTPSSCASFTLMSGPQKVSRKQKSLGLLCEKFISRFPEAVPDGEKCEIPLDDLAKQMCTERRRIYDIVNVLEAVQMMTKIGKNLYQWHGSTHRLMTLAWLRQLALKLSLLERYLEAKQHCEEVENYGFLSPGSTNNSPADSRGLLSPFSPTYSSTGTSPASSTGGPSPSPIERKTSLGVACQKFLMLFLIAPEPSAKINLEFAAKVIHGPYLPDAVMKTRIRRLYDIANILQSLHLIQKVQITESHGARKPAFEYIGPDIKSIEVTQEVLSSLPVTRQRHSLLAVGKNLLNIPDDDPRAPPPTHTSQIAMPIVSPPQHQLQKVTLISSPNIPASTPTPMAYESCKPFKKRVLTDTGFGITPVNFQSFQDIQNGTYIQRNAKLPRTVSADNVAMSSNAVVISSYNTTRHQNISNEEDQENKPQTANGVCITSSLMDLSKACEVERTKTSIKIPSPNYFGASRSLLRNSPINLSMDRRNAHIISPLALTTHNRSNGFAVRVRPSSHIIPPSPTNTTPSGLYRKGPSAPSPLMNSASRYVKLSPTMTARGSPLRGSQQSPMLAMRKPFSPTSLITLNHHQDQITHSSQDPYGQRIKVLRMPSQDTGEKYSSSGALGNTTNNMRLVGLNNGKTVIALVSKNPNTGVTTSIAESTMPFREGTNSQIANGRIQSPRSSAINLAQKSPAMYRLSRFASNGNSY